MEREYYYILDNEQCGPFVLADLLDVKLPADIMVWYEGLEDWKPAGTLPELQVLYNEPAIDQNTGMPYGQGNTVVKPRGSSTLKFFRILLAIILLLLAVGLVGSGFENEELSITPFVLAVIFLGVGLWLLLKKSKHRNTSAANQSDYREAQGNIYAQQMNMMQQEDYNNDDDYNDYDDFD